MSSIASVTSTPAGQSASFTSPSADTRTTGSKTLGVQDFLKLITVQLTAQDPLKPMEDTQFISQMASFTSLEQMQTLSKDFSTFTSQQKASGAQDYLGKTVTIATANGNITGPVAKVSFQDGAAMLSVNGNDYDVSNVISVTVTPPVTTASPSNS
jgi:flagellar basal-body rod modification protein FlgD